MKLLNIGINWKKTAALSLAAVLLVAPLETLAITETAAEPTEMQTEAATVAAESESDSVAETESDSVAETESDSTAETELDSAAETGTEQSDERRDIMPRADYSGSLTILDYQLLNGGGTAATEFAVGDRVRLRVEFEIAPLPSLKAPGDTFEIQLPPDDKIEFSGSGTIGAFLNYHVAADRLVLTLTAAGAGEDRISGGLIHLPGRAKEAGAALNGGGDGRYDGLITVTPPPPAPPVEIDNDIVFPDYNKDLRARGNQWGGANVLAWAGQVNYWGHSDLFGGGNTVKTDALITAHLIPGTKFRDGSLYVTVPCYIGTNSGVMGERQIGEARISGVDQAVNFRDPLIHDDNSGIIGFTRLDPASASYEEFRERVEKYPALNGGQRAYGVYVHDDGTETVLISFGDLGGGDHYYDQLTKNFVAPYGDIDIFQAIYNDASLSQAQKDQLYDLYSRSGPSGGAITTYDFSFAVDVNVPTYMDGLYEHEIIFSHSGGAVETAQTDFPFTPQYSTTESDFLVVKANVTGSGIIENPHHFYYEIVDDSGTTAAYGRTDLAAAERGLEYGITFYKDPAYTTPIENSNKLSPDYWSSVLAVGRWYFLKAVKPPGYTARISDYRTDVLTSRFMYQSGISNLWKFKIAHTEETTTVEGEKIWDDENDKLRKRPDQITVNLYADNILQDTRIVTAGADGTWRYQFADVPAYKNGVLVQYRVDEVPVPEYSTVITGYNIKNTHIESDNSSFQAFDFSCGVKQNADQENTDLTADMVRRLSEAWAQTANGTRYQDNIAVDEKQLEVINAAKHLWYVLGARYSGAAVFDLTFTALDGAKITVKVALYSNIAPATADAQALSANDFTYDVAGGPLDAAQAKEYSGSALSGKDRAQLDMEQISVNSEQLQLINTKISKRELGTYPLTISAPGDKKLTLKVTLIGTVIAVRESGYPIKGGILSESRLKEILIMNAVDPWGSAIDHSRISVGEGDLAAVNEMIEAQEQGSRVVTFSTADGTTAEARLLVQMGTGAVKINKVDSVSNRPLAGAKLTLTDKDGNTVEEWTTTTESYQVRSTLQPGADYTLQERQAPIGYLLTAPVTFTFEGHETLQEVISKGRKKAPQQNITKTVAPNKVVPNPVVTTSAAPTGDANEVRLLFLLLLLSTGIIVKCIYIRKTPA